MVIFHAGRDRLKRQEFSTLSVHLGGGEVRRPLENPLEIENVVM